MERFFNILAAVGLAVMLVALGWLVGRQGAKPVIAGSVTATDTVWVETHDTCWVERAVTLLRTDTVRLAYVPEIGESGAYQDGYGHENGVSWTCQDGYGHENGISGAYRDTLFIHDSVYVEVPITRKVFTGDNYSITAEGFRVRLTDVSITYPSVTSTVTGVSARKSRWGIGVQAGCGLSTKGLAPYIGIGVSYNILVW